MISEQVGKSLDNSSSVNLTLHLAIAAYFLMRL